MKNTANDADAPTPVTGSRRSRLLAIALGLGLGLGVAEAVLREIVDPTVFVVGGVGGDRWVAHPFLPFAGRPGAEIRFRVPQIDAEVFARNNAYGFRAHAFPAEKGPEDFFIICLGGSTTWGAAAPSNAQTWPEILERLLAERYPQRNFKAFNFGTDFATSVYGLVTLSLVGVHLQPDLIIVYDGWNDFGPSNALHYKTDHSHFFTDFDPSDTSRGLQRSLPSWLRSLRSVTILTFVVDSWLGVNDIGSYVTMDYASEISDPVISSGRVAENFRTVHAIARGHGAQVVFSTFQFRDGRPRHNDAFRAFFEANGFLYVDQERLIPDHDPTLQFDLGHFTDKGRETMARNLLDYIVAKGLVSGSP